MDLRRDKIRVITEAQIMYDENAENGTEEGGGAREKSGMASWKKWHLSKVLKDEQHSKMERKVGGSPVLGRKISAT